MLLSQPQLVRNHFFVSLRKEQQDYNGATFWSLPMKFERLRAPTMRMAKTEEISYHQLGSSAGPRLIFGGWVEGGGLLKFHVPFWRIFVGSFKGGKNGLTIERRNSL